MCNIAIEKQSDTTYFIYFEMSYNEDERKHFSTFYDAEFFRELSISSGRGKIMVEFFSAEIALNV